MPLHNSEIEMKYFCVGLIFLGSILTSNGLMADSCSDIEQYDELASEVYVVCPSLPTLTELQLAKIVTAIFSTLNFVADEHTIHFVASIQGLPPATLRDEDLVGRYYTHDHSVYMWPNIKAKRHLIRLKP